MIKNKPMIMISTIIIYIAHNNYTVNDSCLGKWTGGILISNVHELQRTTLLVATSEQDTNDCMFEVSDVMYSMDNLLTE